MKAIITLQAIISKDKFISLENSKNYLGFTIEYKTNPIFIDPRNELLGARLIASLENVYIYQLKN